MKGIKQRLERAKKKAVAGGSTKAKPIDNMPKAVEEKESGVRALKLSNNVARAMKGEKPQSTMRCKPSTSISRKRPTHIERGGQTTKKQKPTRPKAAAQYLVQKSLCSSVSSAVDNKIGGRLIQKIITKDDASKSKVIQFKCNVVGLMSIPMISLCP